MLSNPSLDEFPVLFRFLEHLASLRFCNHFGLIVVDDVSLPPASLEVIREGLSSGTQNEPSCLESRLVMAWKGRGNTISPSRQGHLGKLKRRVISCREPAIARKTPNGGIVQVPLHEFPQTGDFADAR